MVAIKPPAKRKLLIRKVNKIKSYLDKIKSPSKKKVFIKSVVVKYINSTLPYNHENQEAVLFVCKLTTQLKHVGWISNVSNVMNVII